LGDGGGRGRDIEVEPPRLLAASVEHQRGTQQAHDRDQQQAELGGDRSVGEWEKTNEREKSPPSLGTDSPKGSSKGDQSPRRYGRNRTDTMVFSEAFNAAEELSKGDERELDGGQGKNAVQSAAGATTQGILEAPVVSQPEIIIDELEVPSIEPAVPPVEELEPDLQQDSVESAQHVEGPETIAEAAESSEPDTSVPKESALEQPAVPASTTISAADVAVEDASVPEPTVEDAPKAEPEEPPSDVSHSPEPEPSTVPDTPAIDTVPASTDSDNVNSERDEDLHHTVVDTSETNLSESTKQSVSEDVTSEQETELAQDEHTAEEAAEVTPVLSSEVETETEPPS